MKHKKVYNEEGKLIPVRMCVACREHKPKDQLVLIRAVEGEAKANGKTGRGAYVCKNEKCIEKAQKIRGLERGLKAQVPESLYKELTDIVNNKS